jgi:hypothetical protein
MKKDRALPRYLSRRLPPGVVPSLAVGLLTAGLLVAALAAPSGLVKPARAAAADFVFTGRGWGHGVGMSQWGAWAAARDGKTYQDILAFYYPSTSLDTLTGPDTELRVKISSEPWKNVDSITQDYLQVDLTRCRRRPSTSADIRGYQR